MLNHVSRGPRTKRYSTGAKGIATADINAADFVVRPPSRLFTHIHNRRTGVAADASSDDPAAIPANRPAPTASKGPRRWTARTLKRKAAAPAKRHMPYGCDSAPYTKTSGRWEERRVGEK